MTDFKIYKEVSSVPNVLTANSMYAVRTGIGFDLYLTDVTGAIAHKINVPEITQAIGDSLTKVPSQDFLTKQLKAVRDDINALSKDATTTVKGIVQLSSATNSTSTTLAATPSAVKAAFDKGNAAIPNAAKGAVNGIASLDADGKVPSTQLPTPAASVSVVNATGQSTTDAVSQKLLTDQIKALRDDMAETFTQAAYNALPVKNPKKLYVLQG